MSLSTHGAPSESDVAPKSNFFNKILHMKSTASEPGLSDSVNEFFTSKWSFIFRNQLKKNCLIFTPNPLSWTEKTLYKNGTNLGQVICA